MRELNREELEWLDSRAGRDENDVHWDEEGKPYVFMTDGHKNEVEVYIPKNYKKETRK